MKKSLIVGLLVSAMFLSFANIAFAVHAGGLPHEVVKLPELGERGLFDLFAVAANIIFTGLLIVASIFILLAAFQFVTGGGNAEALEQARGKLIWAVVGVAVAFLAKALPGVIQGLLRATP